MLIEITVVKNFKFILSYLLWNTKDCAFLEEFCHLFKKINIVLMVIYSHISFIANKLI